MVGLPDAWGGLARDLSIRFEAGVDVSLDLADGAAMAAARAIFPVISKSDRRAPPRSRQARRLRRPRNAGPARDPGSHDGADAADG